VNKIHSALATIVISRPVLVHQIALPPPTLTAAIAPLTQTVPQPTAAFPLAPAPAPAPLSMYLVSTPLAATAPQTPTALLDLVTPPLAFVFRIVLEHLL